MGGGGLSWSDFDPTSSHFAGGKNAKGGGDGPSAPDFNEAARIQADSSRDITREQTQANRPDQTSAFGYSDWTQNADGSWSQQTGLSPGLASTANRLTGQISSGASLDPTQERDRAIEAAYGQSTSRLDPQWSQRESQLAQQLANQGFSLTDDAARTATADLGRQRNDAYQQAMYGAQTGAGNVAFDQSLAANMQPYQQLGALKGLGEQGGFTSAQGAQPLQSLAAAMQGYGANLDSYNANQASKNSKMSGAASLAPLAASASDERLKTDIQRLEAEALPGVPFARWKWKDSGDVGFGVIAQDLEKVRPDLVVEIGGIKHVRYGGLR